MIKIEKLHLKKYRNFRNTTIEFCEHITCMSGLNGSGKTSILDALSNILQSSNIGTEDSIELKALADDENFTLQITSDVEKNYIENKSFIDYKSAHNFVFSYYDINRLTFKKYENINYRAIIEDTKLNVIRNVLSALITNFDSSQDLSFLSDGEKSVVFLFCDIAQQLMMANKLLENPLIGNGIILIDEIELHMHPSWQRKICHLLIKTFPNCQFVITTHSPQILGELKPNEILLLNNFKVYHPDSSFGLSSNQILDELMDILDEDYSLSRNSMIAKKLDQLNEAMELNKFSDAKKIITEIKNIVGQNLHETEASKIALEMMEK